jgi:glycosyltransferase involved in cell wall biosynthesis
MRTSVALCTYNGEAFVNTQLESILNQTVPVDELIILDDKSTDNTVQAIERIVQKSSIKIKLLKNELNLGAIKSFEKCIQACTGEIIFLADQDDIWLPTKVEKVLKAFESDSQAVAIFSDGELIDANGIRTGDTLWSKWGFTQALQQKWRDDNFAFSELLLNHNVITGATLAFKKQLVPHLVPFKLPVTYWHDLWIGLIAAGLGGLRFIEEPTILYRVHIAQQVGLTSGGNDKRYQHVSHETFFQKVAVMFPGKQDIISNKAARTKAPLPPSIWQRLIRMLHRGS